MTVAATRAADLSRRSGLRNDRPPRAGSKMPISSGGSAEPGRNQWGVIAISDNVVAKLAARATLENPNAGAAASTVLGLTLPGSGLLGTKVTSLGALPKSSATVDGALATVELTISVRWPNSVATVSSEIRDHVRSRLQELTGLNIKTVQIYVTDLASTITPPRRIN